MIFQRLRETLHFFWHHLTELLWRLLPLLPLLVLANYRFLVTLEGSPAKAETDALLLLPQMLAGVGATALTIRYTLAVVQRQDCGWRTLWRQALPRLLPLVAVQILAGFLILGGLLLLILPGLYLMAVLLPAYVVVVAEDKAPLAALQAAWQRFRADAWIMLANLLVVFALMLTAVIGLDTLQQQLALTAVPLPLQLAADSGLDLIELLFSQLLGILLVRCYELERQQGRRPGPA